MTVYFPEADHGFIFVTSWLTSLWQLGSDKKLEPVNEVQWESIFTNSFGKSVKGESYFECRLVQI